jgi:methionine-rich copper-binding protein CopC
MKRVVLGVLLVASLLACGGNVTPQNNGKNENNANNGGNGDTAGDTTVPTLTSSAPVSGAASVAVNSKIKLTFSEKMDTASVTVVADPNSDLGDPTWDAAGINLSLNPPITLETSSAYTLTINGKDAAGNVLAETDVRFITADDSNPPPPADTTAPTIVSSSPDDGNSGVAINANILITFSEAMNPGSVAVSISPSVGLGAAAFKTGNNTVEFNPPSDLAGNTNYTVTVDGKDVAGNDLTGSSSFSFKTASIADTTAPGIPQNVVAEAGDSQIKFTWSTNTEPDLKGYTIYYSNNASNLSSSVFVAKPGTSKTLTGLTNGEIYFYQLEAEDGSGNRSGRTITKNATPKDTTAPRLLSSSPASGAVNVPASSKVVFNFSESMNTTTSRPIRPCVPLSNRPDASCGVADTIVWDNDNKRLTISYTGSRIGTAIVPTFRFESAEDKAGNRLPNTVITFNLIDNVAPQLLSFAPLNRAVDVSRDTSITLKFTRPMDTASVQSQFASTNTGLGTFSWDGTESIMTFKPFRTLVAGGEITWRLNAGAKDKVGNLLANSYAGSFTVFLNTYTTTVPYYGSGHILRKCVSAPRSCDDTAYANTGVIRIGDRKVSLRGAVLTTEYSMGYIAFKINDIPANAIIVSARLQVFHRDTKGNPFGVLGNLMLERVNPQQNIAGGYSLGGDRGDFNLPSLSCTTCPQIVRPLSSVNISEDVTAFLVADRANRATTSQFRLRFTGSIADPNTDDYLDYSQVPTLTITYKAP